MSGNQRGRRGQGEAAGSFILLVSILFGLTGASCLVDDNPKCGAYQVLDAQHLCVCAENAVWSTVSVSACVPCGPGETAVANKCGCAVGSAHNAAGICEAIPAGLGVACTIGGAECLTAAFPYCAVSGQAGYCTSSGCTTHADCPLDYSCDPTTVPGHCRKAPTGQGMMCESDPDCAGTDATLCLPVLNCSIQGCQLAPNSCPRGLTCCDLTARGLAKNVCIPGSGCP